MKRLIPLILLLIVGCSYFTEPAGQGTLVLNIMFYDDLNAALSSGKPFADRVVDTGDDSVYAIVSKGGEVVWENALEDAGAYFESNIDLNEGNGYEVEIEYYVGSYLAYTGQETGIEIKAEKTATTEIILYPTVPLAPSDLSVTVIPDDAIQLTWVDNSVNEDSISVERSIGVSGNFIPLIDLGADCTNYLDSGLSEGTTYFYRVCSFNTAGNSGYSNMAYGSTPQVSPILSYSPDSIGFDSTEVNLTFIVWNSGAGVLNYNFAESASWISSINPSSGSSTGEFDTILVAINRSGLSSGAYDEDITITSNGGNGTVAANMMVPYTPPTMTSAALHLAVESMAFSNFTFSIAQITSPNWTETGATWNNTMIGYDASTIEEKYLDHLGSYQIDLVDIVHNWIDGESNFGIAVFVANVQNDDYARISSSENQYPENRPKIVVEYSDGSEYTLQANADTYLNQEQPDTNFGSEGSVKIGCVNSSTGDEARALIKFDLTSLP